MKARIFQITPPEISIPLTQAVGLTTQAGSASATYEKAVWAAFAANAALAARLVPKSALTGLAAGGIGFLNLWRNGVQVSSDGLLGAYNFAAVGANYALTAQQPANLVTNAAYGWFGTIGAVTANSSTGATATAVGSSALNDGMVTATSTLIVDPGLPTQETIVLSAFNSGTGVFTLANSAKFANTHPAGTLVALPATTLWQGTTSAVTANSSTSATLTATGVSSTSGLISANYPLTFDPGLATQETLPVGSFTYATGTVTIAATYNAGKFLQSHASGGRVWILPSQTGGYPLVSSYLAGDVVTFKWTQLGTGLALPESVLFVDYGLRLV